MAQRDNLAMSQAHRDTPLLGGMTPAQFMRRHWHKQPLLVRQAWPGVAPPVERAALFTLAARDDVESRLVRQEGRRWHLRPGPLPRRALPPLSRPCWTLLLQGLDLHLDAAHEMLRRFRFVPDARLDDLMLSYASDGGGVGPHIDSYDVFLLQVAGRRRWRIGRCERPEWRDDVPLKMLRRFDVEQDWVLERGDMLYLPPGWAHEGSAVGGDCMTASIGYRAPTTSELVRALLDRLGDGLAEPSGRYRDPRQGATMQPGAIPAAMQSFARRAVTRSISRPGEVECALGEWLTEPKAQVWFEAAERGPVLGADNGVALDRRTRMAYDMQRIYVNGESFRATGRDAGLMRRLADRRGLPSQEVARLSAGARALVGDWLGAGWVHAKGDDDEQR